MNIKAIIFDLDGVLVNTKDLHFKALNNSISIFDKNYIISYEDHLSIYDGLSTKEKLDKLAKLGLNNELVEKIHIQKQIITKKMIESEIIFNSDIFDLFSKLYDDGYKLTIATNSIRDTLNIIIDNLKIADFLSLSMSNEDVILPKPHSEIYLKTFLKLGLNPKECLIIEDSKLGREAAYNSGAYCYEIEHPETDLKYEHILNRVKRSESFKMTWKSDNLNILIPMAGKGSRFLEQGFSFPKPLISIKNKPMIQVVLENLAIEAKFIFIVLKEHSEKYNLRNLLKLCTKNNCEIVEIDEITEGAASTSLLAKKYINNDKGLIIANSDQFIKWDSSATMYEMVTSKIDGGILTFKSTHPKWSFAKVDKNNFVIEVAEKNPISTNATVGIYYWKQGLDYVKYAEQMIAKNVRVNNEFYICPVYNEAIQDNKKIIIKEIDEMWGLGTPEDLSEFSDSEHYKKL
tara:strand:+ start:6847 stop:8226 length:1380 start_codon:yes stop_codon:yes gene_type:complete